MVQRTQNVDASVAALDVRDIRSIELTTGWHKVTGCELLQFAIGNSHSPISPQKLYPTLRYIDEVGNEVYTPLAQVLSFSESDVVSEMQQSQSQQSGGRQSQNQFAGSR